MASQCHGGGRASFSDLQYVAIEVVPADDFVAKAALELHFVLHVESCLVISSWSLAEKRAQKMSVIEIFRQLTHFATQETPQRKCTPHIRVSCECVGPKTFLLEDHAKRPSR